MNNNIEKTNKKNTKKKLYNLLWISTALAFFLPLLFLKINMTLASYALFIGLPFFLLVDLVLIIIIQVKKFKEKESLESDISNGMSFTFILIVLLAVLFVIFAIIFINSIGDGCINALDQLE